MNLLVAIEHERRWCLLLISLGIQEQPLHGPLFFLLFLSSYEYCKWDDNSCPQLFQDFHRELFIRDFKKNKSHSFLCHLIVSLLWLDIFREQEKSELDVEGGQMQGDVSGSIKIRALCEAHCDCKRKERIFKIDLFCPFPPPT